MHSYRFIYRHSVSLQMKKCVFVFVRRVMLSRHLVQELRPRNTGAIRQGNQTREKRGNTQQICYSFGSPVTTRQDPIPCSSISFRSIWIYSFGQEFSYYHPSVGRIRGRSSWSDKTSSWAKKSMEWQIYTLNEITSFDYSWRLETRDKMNWSTDRFQVIALILGKSNLQINESTACSQEIRSGYGNGIICWMGRKMRRNAVGDCAGRRCISGVECRWMIIKIYVVVDKTKPTMAI